MLCGSDEYTILQKREISLYVSYREKARPRACCEHVFHLFFISREMKREIMWLGQRNYFFWVKIGFCSFVVFFLPPLVWDSCLVALFFFLLSDIKILLHNVRHRFFIRQLTEQFTSGRKHLLPHRYRVATDTWTKKGCWYSLSPRLKKRSISFSSLYRDDLEKLVLLSLVIQQ